MKRKYSRRTDSSVKTARLLRSLELKGSKHSHNDTIKQQDVSTEAGFGEGEYASNEPSPNIALLGCNSRINNLFHSLWDEKMCCYLPITLYSAYTLILFLVVQLGLSKAGTEKLLQFLQAFLAKTKHMFFKCLNYNCQMRKIYFCRAHGCMSTSSPCIQCNLPMEFFLWCNPTQQLVDRLRSKILWTYRLHYHEELSRHCNSHPLPM